jgi:hypothetical protein
VKFTVRGAAATAFILTGIISLLGGWFMWYMTPRMASYFYGIGLSSRLPVGTDLTVVHGRFLAILLVASGIALLVGTTCDQRGVRAKFASVAKAVGTLTFAVITMTSFAAWVIPLYVINVDQTEHSTIEWNLRVREFADQYTFSKAIKRTEMREIPGNELNPSEVDFGSHILGTWASTVIASDNRIHELQFRTMHLTADGIATFTDIVAGEKTLPATEVWSSEYDLETAPEFRIQIKGE